MKLLPEADEVVPLLVRVGVGILVAWLATGRVGSVEEVEHRTLDRQEAVAGVNAAKSETDTAYDEYYELVTYHAVRDAACDTALEAFARHREDDHDWARVLGECHSEEPIHSYPAEDPNQ